MKAYRTTALTLAVAMGMCLSLSPAAHAGGKKVKGTEIKLEKGTPARVDAMLTDDDPAEGGKHYKLYRVRLEKGTEYQIDLMSKDMDSYLYVKDGEGNALAMDDDGGMGLNSRLRFTPEETADYQLVATTFPADQTGGFTLLVAEKGAVAKGGKGTELKLAKGKAQVESQISDDDGQYKNKRGKTFTCKFSAKKSYQIDMDSGDFDAFLFLLDANGKFLEQNDDREANNLNSTISYVPTKDGTYRIFATSLSGNDTGNFTLKVTESGASGPEEKVNEIKKAIDIKLKADGPTTVKGELAADDPEMNGKHYKAYKVHFEKGKSYRIDQKSEEFDSYLILRGPDGEQLAEDDDSGGDLNSRITYKATESGDYRILATSLQNAETGNFTLIITAPKAAKEGAATALKLKAGKASAEGRLEDGDPVFQGRRHKAYSVDLEEGKTYKIDLVSGDFDAYLILQNPDGKVVAQDDDSGGDLNSRIVHEAKDGGRYRILAGSLGNNGMGEFTLKIVEASKDEKEQSRLEDRVRELAKSDPAEQKKLVQELATILAARAAKLSAEDAQLARQAAAALEEDESSSAVDAYRSFGKVLRSSDDPKVASTGRRLEGAARRLELPGKEMQLQAVAVDGKDVDLAKLRGKVVLVDFWATWCPPCVAELPNVKKAYKKYHKDGFEVIGVSLDRSKAKLTKFIEKEEIPWPCIYDADASDESKLAENYGILGIPLPILVDRDGHVVSMNARGEDLQQLLSKLFEKSKS